MSIEEFIQSNENVNLNSHEILNKYNIFFKNNKYKEEK